MSSAIGIVLILALSVAGFLLIDGAGSAFLLIGLVPLIFLTYLLVFQAFLYRSEVRLAEMTVSLAAHGVTYTSTLGAFTAPWSSVRQVAMTRDGGVLRINVENWGGPAALIGKVCRMRVPLEHAVDPRAVAHIVSVHSGGRLTLAAN